MLTFNGIHISYDNCDSYTFKQKEVLMVQPFYLAFAIIKLGELHKNETNHGKLQPYFGEDKLQLHYMGCESFILSLKREKGSKVLKTSEDIFDFSNLDKDHELFSN